MKKKHIQLFFLIVFLLTTLGYSQNLSKKYSSKIHPFFQTEIERVQTGILTNSIGVNSVDNTIQGDKIYSAILKIDDEQEILNSDIKINSVIPGYATARVTLVEMEDLARLNSVSYIYPGEIMYPTNDVAGGISGADLVRSGYINSTAYDGTDVIVLVVDTGIDWSHADFQNSASPNTSRILYIWDQTLSKTGSEKTPEDRDGVNFAGLNYGVEYTQADINNEIDGSPAGFVREKDNNGHGTHVTGSAAGNGASSSGKYSGMAPGADIVFVKAGDGSFLTSNLIDALTYARQISDTEGKPVVVNMSLGGQANAHDGTRDLDVAVDNFTGSGNGRVAVVSAGNDGENAIHITGTTAVSATSNIIINIPSYTANSGTGDDYFYTDLWWSNGDNVDVTVTSPNGYTHTQIANSQGTGSTADGYIYIFNYVDAGYTNGDRRNYFKIYDGVSSNPPAQGNWTLAVTNQSASTMTYHAWLSNKSMGASLTGGNTDYTVGSPGVATSAITVGAYVSRWKWRGSDGGNYAPSGTDRSDDIAGFSSIGPTRDGRTKPDIAAPGQAIISCTSTDASVDPSNAINSNYHKNQGTSMSSPVTAGCVALMLDYDATLTYAQVKTHIIGSAETDSYTGGALPDYVWGYGKLNVFNAISNIYQGATTSFNNLYSYDSWSGDASTSISSGTKIAVKFSPTSSGDVTGALFHPSSTVDLTGPMYFEIWSDDGSGLPNAKLGSTVSYDYSEILKYSWNYVDLSGTGVNVTSGTDYHIVMYYSSGSGFYIRYDNGSVDARSSYDSGSGWSSYGSGDFRLRTVVSTPQSTLPVELSNFSVTPNGNTMLLNWTTATEVDNYGFEIERSSLSASPVRTWETVGFVEGHGNSSSSNSYSFVDGDVEGGNVKYRLNQIDIDGTSKYSEEVEVVLDVAYKYSMEQNHPNPFNPTTTISYTIPTNSKVKIEIYNSLGQKVSELVNKTQTTGNHFVNWDATNFSSGTYFARLIATSLNSKERFSEVKKLLLLK